MIDRTKATVLSIDQGRTCGWALAVGNEVTYGEDEAFRFIGRTLTLLDAYDFDRVVLERIDPRRWDNEIKFTVEVTGALKWIIWSYDVPLAEVNPADKKKTIGEVIPEVKGHARDAEALRLWDLRYGTW